MIKQPCKVRKSFLAVSIASIISVPSLALAQQSNPDDEIEVIEVTSQKRSQNIMDVPLSVDAFSAKDLSTTGSVSIGDVDNYIPGLEIGDSSVTQTGVTIRGVSSPGISTGGDPSVASFFDDVYMPRAAQNVLFSDIQRIEVLKGPQGTLFGRNAAAGVVSVIPNAPGDELEGFVQAKVGNYDLKRFEGMLNVPLSDSVFFRVNALSNQRGGIAENIANSNRDLDPGAKNHFAARASLFWQISSDTDLQISYDYDDLDQAPPPAFGLSEHAYGQGLSSFSGLLANDIENGEEGREMDAITLKLNHTFTDEWSMKLVSSYRDWATVNRQDEDGTAVLSRYFGTSNNEDSDIHYNELQINYNSDNLNFVGGITYSKEEIYQETELLTNTDTAARLVTVQGLNPMFTALVADGVRAQLDAAGLTTITNGDLDRAAQLAGADSFGQIVDGEAAKLGLPLNTIWNMEEVAGIMNLLNSSPELGMQGAVAPLFEQLAPVMQALGVTELSESVFLAAEQFAPGTVNAIYDAIGFGLAGDARFFGPMGNSGIPWVEYVRNTGEFTNVGIYSDFDFKLNDKWNWIVGLRYSKDEKKFSWEVPINSYASVRPGLGISASQLLSGGGIGFTTDASDSFPTATDLDGDGVPDVAGYSPLTNLVFGQIPYYDVSNEWSKVTGRTVLQYKPDDDKMVFVSYSTGYKSGGYDSLAPVYIDCNNNSHEFCASQPAELAGNYSFQSPFAPEESTNIEVGYKADLLNGDLRLQTSFYELEIDNRQNTVTTLNPEDNGVAKPRVINGNEKLRGMELILDWHVSESFTAGLVTEYRNSRADWDDFYNADGELINGVTSSSGANTFTLNLDWNTEAWNGYLHTHVDFYYKENTRENDPNTLPWMLNLPGFLDNEKLLNARVAWSNEDENIEVALWGKNLLDEQYLSGVNNITTTLLGTPYSRISDPLTWGLDFKYTF